MGRQKTTILSQSGHEQIMANGWWLMSMEDGGPSTEDGAINHSH
jgi:hypothetical protein